MDEIIAKLEENFGVKFNDHKKGIKAYIQNLFAEFKEKILKKVFRTIFAARREDKHP